MNKLPLKKPTGLIATHPIFQKYLGKTCKRNHVHGQCMGGRKVTTDAGVYTKKFARRICLALMDVLHEDASRTNAAFPVAADQEAPDPTDGVEDPQDPPPDDLLGARAITFPKDTKPSLQKTLRRLHQNLGHPSRADLERNMRLNGASKEVLVAVRQMRCQTCERLRPKTSSRPAKLQHTGNFNEDVGLDFIYVKDSN